MDGLEFLRQFHIFGYAIFDFVVSFLGIYLMSPLLSRGMLKFGWKVPKVNWLFLTLPFSLLIHVVFNNMTPMTRDFLDIEGYYILKIIIIGCFVLGLRGIRKKKS